MTERYQGAQDDRTGPRPLLRLCLMAGLASAAAGTAARAQPAEAPVLPTAEQTLALLPDPERYRLVILDEGLSPDAVQIIGTRIIDTLGEDHFFGAVAAHLPKDSRQLAIRLRAKLHSIEAAERAALDDCEAERTEGASACRLIGQILPEEWTDDTPDLSHDVMYALSQSAGRLDGPIVVARSRDTASWAIWGGEDTRQSALDECNAAVRAAGAVPDCDIVVEDAP
ncbi:hypothetical protein E4191_14510 [Paracoccus liaowanqingii]|uniref:DUF4189 domain-containing protein n=1 Tax=Paracoccus liaowanqingii TaxID=2560053 RepID=A0A4P7HNC2_9RHOB|nr:hypothetical protein [Paracoccus liaowanqingii]QBX35765.1 hypothetical protein E4191_14510 [Paracoccus liaowanqingii]